MLDICPMHIKMLHGLFVGRHITKAPLCLVAAEVEGLYFGLPDWLK
jgi:hypothetical protein